MREFKRNVTTAEPASSGPGSQDSTPDKKDHKNDTTQQPEQKQERNYSQTENQISSGQRSSGSIFFDPSNPDLPVVSVTTYRRFV